MSVPSTNIIPAMPLIRVELVRPAAPSSSGAMIGRTTDGTWYVVKPPWNNHDRFLASDGPTKTLTTEYLCGRLGQLWNPPVTPVTVLVDIISKTEARSSGPDGILIGVASKLVYDCVETKHDFSQLPRNRYTVRTLVFQTWLNATDPSVLWQPSTGRVFSIDHEWYITGRRWDFGALVKHVYRTIAVDWKRFDLRIIRDAVSELLAIPKEDFREIVGGIPFAWGLDGELRGAIVDWLARRRGELKRELM